MKNNKRTVNSISDDIVGLLNAANVKKLFRLGSEVFSAAQPFMEKQTPYNAIRAILAIGKVAVDQIEIWPEVYFSEWDILYPPDFTNVVMSAIANKPKRQIKTHNEMISIHIVSLAPGVDVGYVSNTKNSFVDKIFVTEGRSIEAREIIKKDLWSLLKDDNIVIRKRNTRTLNIDGSIDDAVRLEKDDDFISMASKRSKDYSEYLKKFMNAGVSRSVMLYGPPGTGKSTLARTIVTQLGLKSFRIRVEDIGEIETQTLFEAIDIFQPDVVIIDDFDRSHDQTAMLEILEYFQRHVKIVISTVNKRNRIDEAILRPGRFDELVYINQMDEDVVKTILGEDNMDAFDIVKDWPVAFIQEFIKRRRFMTKDEAESSIKELAERVVRLSKYDESDSSNDFDKILVQNKHVGDAFENFDDLMKNTKKSSKVRR